MCVRPLDYYLGAYLVEQGDELETESGSREGDGEGEGDSGAMGELLQALEEIASWDSAETKLEKKAVKIASLSTRESKSRQKSLSCKNCDTLTQPLNIGSRKIKGLWCAGRVACRLYGRIATKKDVPSLLN